MSSVNNVLVGKNKHPHAERLLGYPSEVWTELVSNSVWTKVVGVSKSSLTLLNQYVLQIASTRNNKQRRKLIFNLVAYTELDTASINTLYYNASIHMSSLTHWLCDIMYILSDKYLPVVPPQIRYITKDNSPEYAPFYVGDSTSFSSCLRSGVIKYIKDEGLDANTLTDAWYLDYAYCDLDDKPDGCNAHYLPAEAQAFKDGRIMYAIVGNMVYEDGKGPKTRIRVHINVDKSTGDTLYFVDHTYGDAVNTVPIINKLCQDFPNRVCLLSANNKRASYDVVHTKTLKCNYIVPKEVYSDTGHVEAYALVSVDRVAPFAKLGKSSRDGNITIVKLLMPNSEALRISCISPKKDDKESSSPFSKEYLTKLRSVTFSRQPGALCNNSMMSPIIVYLSNHYGLPVIPYDKLDDSRIHHQLRMYSSITLGISTVEWTMRGCEYTIYRSYCDLVTITLSRESTTGIYYYNLKRGKWVTVSHYRHDLNRHEYSITRHTFRCITKFLPKHLTPKESNEYNTYRILNLPEL